MKQASCILIHRPDHKILVVGRRHDPHLICLPGGKRDTGETARECAVRELAEETGLTVDAERLSPLVIGPCESEPGGAADFEVAVFTCPWDEDMGYPQTMEINVTPQWVMPERLVTHGAMPVFNALIVRLWKAFQAA